MGNYDRLIKLMHSKNELQAARQSARGKLNRLLSYQMHMNKVDFDKKNPPRTVYNPWTWSNKEPKTHRLLVPKSWIRLSRTKRKYLVQKAELEALKTTIAVKEFTFAHGKEIKELLKQSDMCAVRCRYNHYYTGLYTREEESKRLVYTVKSRKQIEQEALKIIAEECLIGG